MSFDPYAAGSEPPTENDAALPLAGNVSDAKQRVQAPAIALIVVGLVNLLVTILQVGLTIWMAVIPAQQLQQMVKDRLAIAEQSGLVTPEMRKNLEENWSNPDAAKASSLSQNVISSLLTALLMVLTLIGGIRMRSLHSYGLSVAGAISAAIPCITCSGTCCFGEIIGIWALVVLLNADVKAAFH
jgi:hypothetical protein